MNFRHRLSKQTFSCLLSCLLFSGVISYQAAEISKNLDSQSTETASSESIAKAKRNALDLAEASLNDGFRVRDGAWVVSLTLQEPRLLQVTLFEGNEYWFIAAAPPPAALLQITIYDAMGHLLKLDPWKDNFTVPGARAAEGFKAPRSGKYFVKLELLKSAGKAKADACLVYAYK
ncbi:MAG: hypothetical protein ACOYK6_06630 [Chthoniobacterales bacterium]